MRLILNAKRQKMCIGCHMTMQSRLLFSPFQLLVSLDREASENVEPTAHGLFKFMKCYKFVATAHLLSVFSLILVASLEYFRKMM